ncbi:M14-type cytosolic carboxypeptidase [Rubripirellula amarantea]|nr:M14-type cytosolic carboxypeptidase [Rubripirellula amarantea]MDA8744913.1 M14-type cytosolic carboxypeptidase [Rubripirellula amarantea]
MCAHTHRFRRVFLAAAISAAGLVVGSTNAIADPSTLISTEVSYESKEHGIRFDTDFPGGKIDSLVEKKDHFEITIKPELEPINDSAWYAFRVKADSEREIQVRLRYEGGSHRYAPKISRDRVNWESAENLVVSRHPTGREVTLNIPVGEKSLWVAGQEIVSEKEVGSWMKGLSTKPDVDQSVIGQSVLGNPLHRVAIGNPDAKDSIFILSRQHPPEVTGTIGMMHFVDAINTDSNLAKKFRENFLTVIVPVANPDGVERGYWRSNANGVDLNRDWLRFTQPETKAIRDEMLTLRDRENGRLWLFLDFHSTFNEVFYTPPRETELFPPGFTTQWVAAIDKRMPAFEMLRDDGHNAHRSTSKAWVARELGIHAVTYEFGDETQRDLIRDIAINSAEEMMRLLLERKADMQ